AGRADYKANTIIVEGYANGINIVDLPTNPDGRNPNDDSIAVFNIGRIIATNAIYAKGGNGLHALGAGVWTYGNGALNLTAWINCPEIEAGSGSALQLEGANGKIYDSGLGAGKISNHSTSNAVIQIWGNATNQVWIGGLAKLTDNNGGGMYQYMGLGSFISNENFTNCGKIQI